MSKKRTLRIEVDFHYERGYNTTAAFEAQQAAWDRLLRAIESVERGTHIVLDEIRSQRLEYADDKPEVRWSRE